MKYKNFFVVERLCFKKPVLYTVIVSLLVLFVSTTFSYSQTTDPYSPYLPSGTDCDITGTAPYIQVNGVGLAGEGAGLALADINKDGKQDIVLMAYDGTAGRNEFRYRIGWNVDLRTGKAWYWSYNYITVDGVGNEGQGAGISTADIDKNGTLDMILLAYDPSDKTFRYRIAWNLMANGIARNVSQSINVDGFGWWQGAAGAGVAIKDINKNGTLDIVLMACANNPGSYDVVNYKIGWDIGVDGKTNNWTRYYFTPGVSVYESQGADISIADIDLDGNLDIVIMSYDNSRDWNTLRYRIGWNLSSNGKVKEWSRWFLLKGVGWEGDGAGLAYHYDQANGPQVIFMAYNDPGNINNFRYFFLPITTSGTCFGIANDIPPLGGGLVVPTSWDTQDGDRLFNLNMREIHNTANDALSLFLFYCLMVGLSGETSDHPETWYNFPDDDVNFAQIAGNSSFSNEICPDLLVAAVAWYVNGNMGWVSDKINEYVINNIHRLGYYAGAEPMPAYYITHYTDPGKHPNLINQLAAADREWNRQHPGDNRNWASEYNDGKKFHGDCEDFAILRHALLRSLGFNRNYIWNGGAPRHEFNVVLYKGAYRIMDYGPIYRYLCEPSSIVAGLSETWNQVYGPRWSTNCENYFKDYVLNRVYPDRCGVDWGWLFTRRARPDFQFSKCPKFQLP